MLVRVDIVGVVYIAVDIVTVVALGAENMCPGNSDMFDGDWDMVIEQVEWALFGRQIVGGDRFLMRKRFVSFFG